MSLRNEMNKLRARLAMLGANDVTKSDYVTYASRGAVTLFFVTATHARARRSSNLLDYLTAGDVERAWGGRFAKWNLQFDQESPQGHVNVARHANHVLSRLRADDRTYARSARRPDNENKHALLAVAEELADRWKEFGGLVSAVRLWLAEKGDEE